MSKKHRIALGKEKVNQWWSKTLENSLPSSFCPPSPEYNPTSANERGKKKVIIKIKMVMSRPQVYYFPIQAMGFCICAWYERIRKVIKIWNWTCHVVNVVKHVVYHWNSPHGCCPIHPRYQVHFSLLVLQLEWPGLVNFIPIFDTNYPISGHRIPKSVVTLPSALLVTEGLAMFALTWSLSCCCWKKALPAVEVLEF